MPVFTYKAFDAEESAVSGTLVADTPRQVREQLLDRGLTVQEVVPRQANSAGKSTGGLRWPGRRHSASALTFIRELATLLGAGIPLSDSIETLAKQYMGGFGSTILQLQDRVVSGTGLAEAMREHPAIFDELDVSIAEVGESAGNLDVVLDRLAEFKEKSASLTGKIGTALIYPAIVLVVAIGVSLLLMTFVVPKLLGSLIEAGHPIPLITRIVKTASDVLVGWWWLILLAVIALVATVSVILHSQRGKLAWHRLQLRIPVLGPAIRKQALARIAIVISTLMRSGIVFVKAVEIAERTTRNIVLKDALAKCQQAVNGGADIARALEDTRAFPPMVVQIFSVGQQSGRLEDMLDRLAADYDRQVSTLTQRLTAILEPILILFMVVLVGFIAVATILPMLEAASAV